MKRIIFLLAILISFKSFSQSKIYIRGDSVFIQGSVNGELILKNSTRAVNGFLYNTGGGVTQFRVIDTSLIANFYAKVHALFSATAPVIYSDGLIGITQATTSTDGYLSSTDWNTFNNKLSTVDTSNISNFYVKVHSLFGATAPITYINGLIGITQSGTASNGYLSSIDWNIFNNKQPAGSYLTSYTETDPIVRAINGIIKSNGTTISAAVAGVDYEAALGNPASNGYVLSSTTAGVRSWVASGSTVTTADSVIVSTAGQTVFPFTSVPANTDDFVVTVWGVLVDPSLYTISGGITFLTGLVNGDKVRYHRTK